MSDLEYLVDDHVATLTFNRPEKKNAFTEDMLVRWRECLVQAQQDDQVRVLVVTGAGDAFCSGGDHSRYQADNGRKATVLERKQRFANYSHAGIAALQDVDKPVIAAVNGPAVGAGMDMALMCDIRLAARSARFSEAYIRVGHVPGNGGCFFLPRLVGVARALELLWMGEFIDADEAVAIGLVNHVFDDAKFMDAVYAYARKLSGMPPIALRAIKRTVYQSLQCDLRTSLELISSHVAIVQSTDDYREAVAA